MISLAALLLVLFAERHFTVSLRPELVTGINVSYQIKHPHAYSADDHRLGIPVRHSVGSRTPGNSSSSKAAAWNSRLSDLQIIPARDAAMFGAKNLTALLF